MSNALFARILTKKHSIHVLKYCPGSWDNNVVEPDERTAYPRHSLFYLNLVILLLINILLTTEESYYSKVYMF